MMMNGSAVILNASPFLMFCIADCMNHTYDTYVVAHVVYPKIHKASKPSATVVTRGGDGALDSEFAEVFGWGLGLNKARSMAT